MRYTDKQYYMDTKLIEKLNLLSDRCSGKNKLDNVIIVDGDEGTGKTTISVACAYYVAHRTKRKFDEKHIFFDIDKLIKFAQDNDDQVIIWDEGALGGLAMDWHNKAQKKLIRFLMVSRKKRHFYFINIPRFFKLPEYLAVDRSIGLIHTYAKDELHLGRFLYFKNRSKEALYDNWKRTRRKGYPAYFNFQGKFTNALPKLINEKVYDDNKNYAIKNLVDRESLTKWKAKLLQFKYKIANGKGISPEDIAKKFNFGAKSIYRWKQLPQQYPNIEFTTDIIR